MPDSDAVTKALIARMAAIRVEKGISQKGLSEATGLSRSGIQFFEKGDVQPSLFFFVEMARGLEVDLAELLADSQEGAE